ncbi:MAG: nucleotidyltransferase, partial [Neobacillus sp.]|nr:nucleotidyltransferase [Neobacillus sp.]
KAQSLTDPHDACKDLPKFLGDKFPVPESVSSRYKKVGLSSAPSSNSAKD